MSNEKYHGNSRHRVIRDSLAVIGAGITSCLHYRSPLNIGHDYTVDNDAYRLFGGAIRYESCLHYVHDMFFSR